MIASRRVVKTYAAARFHIFDQLIRIISRIESLAGQQRQRPFIKSIEQAAQIRVDLIAKTIVKCFRSFGLMADVNDIT